MKLAVVSPAAERHERRDRLRRDRAGALPLRVALPAVQQLRLEFMFRGALSCTPAAQAHVLHPPARAFFEFPCPYADCDGQFNLTDAVNAALAHAAHWTEGDLVCSGSRSQQKGSRRPCELQLTYLVTATYHPQT